jgi:hypothetical protein
MSDKSGLDYRISGMAMSDITSALVANFMGGVRRNRMPAAGFLWGPPGIGKTFATYGAARQIARLTNQEVVIYDVPTSCLEPSDVAGVPFPVSLDGEEQFCRYLGSEWAWFSSVEYEQWMQKQDPSFVAPAGILLFDDLVAAHGQTQAAFFKGVHEGKWGSCTQRPNVMVVGAGNRVSDNAGANDMPTALANRFRHYYAAPTTKDWLLWAGGFREAGEAGVVGEPRIHSLIQAYIRRAEDKLSDFDEDVAMRAEKAFASPRSWENVSELIYEGESIDTGEGEANDSRFAKSCMGIIGRGAAMNFLAFIRGSASLVPAEDIIADPLGAPMPKRSELDALHATVTSLETHIKQNLEHWEKGMQYGLRKDIVSDLGFLLCQSITRVVMSEFSPDDRMAAMDSPVFEQMLTKFEGVLDLIEA